MNFRTLLFPVLLFFLLAPRAKAQSDTLVLTQYKQAPPQAYVMPFASDSTNLWGQPYPSMAPLQHIPHTSLTHPALQLVTAEPDGYVQLMGEPGAIHTLYTSVLATSYEVATLELETDVPHILYINGAEFGQRESFVEDSLLQPHTYSIAFEPSHRYLITLRLMSDTETGNAKVRARFIPVLPHSSLEQNTDGKEYVSLKYMQSGETVYSTAMSASGRYSTLVVKNVVADQPTYRTILYEGNKPIAELNETFRYATWMPRQDKLYASEATDDGKALVAFNPKTQEKEILAVGIPEGDFFMAPNEEYLVYNTEVKGPEKNEVATLVLDRYDRLDGYRDRHFIALYHIPTSAYRTLTYGYRTTSLHGVAPTGDELIFSTAVNTTEVPFSESTYLALNLNTMVADTLFSASSHLHQVFYTTNPEYLLMTGSADAFGGIGRNLPENIVANTYDNQLFLYNRNTKVAEPLTKDFNPNVLSVIVPKADFSAFFMAEDEDYVSLFRCDLKTRKITKIETTEEVVRDFDTDDLGNTLIYTGQSTLNSDRAYLLNLKRKQEVILYDLATPKMQHLALGTAHDWDFTMPNGDRVQGRFYLPPNFDPQKQYPLIVYYYGGTAPTGRDFEGSYSLPMYAAQGYVVYTLNPSGTTGFGQEYAARHVNAWGKRTAEEIIASVKGFCQAHPFVNKEKIGCMGASYGGFMTQYLQTQTDLFAAAVSHAGISALSSYWGEGYWGIGYSAVASHGSYPWNNSELYTKQSPLFNADKINTPLLLLHGDADTNVPDGESVQMYNALKILGKEVEYVQIHGENHGIRDPEKKRWWTNTIFAWFQRWLKDDPTWWETLYPPTQM